VSNNKKQGFNEKFAAGSLGRAVSGSSSVSTGSRPNLLAGLTSTHALKGALVVPIEMVIPNHKQIRKVFDQDALNELADDIKIRGILEPLLVRERGPEEYEIIAGERRVRAAKIAGLSEVPVRVMDLTDREMQLAMLVENIQRLDLTKAEERAFFLELQAEFNYSASDIAKMINKSVSYVSRTLKEEPTITTLESPNEIVNDKPNSLIAPDINSDLNHNLCNMQTLQNNSQSVPNIGSKQSGRFNPGTFKRFSQTLDKALLAVRNKPDVKIVETLRHNVAEMKEKLAALEEELGRVEGFKDKT
jgi:ParB/RepB/Spo0J family partition protein